MDVRFSPIWNDTFRFGIDAEHKCYFTTALQKMNREGNYSANVVLQLNGVQLAMFIDRVRNSKIRTPFIDAVFAKAMALRMGG